MYGFVALVSAWRHESTCSRRSNSSLPIPVVLPVVFREASYTFLYQRSNVSPMSRGISLKETNCTEGSCPWLTIIEPAYSGSLLGWA